MDPPLPSLIAILLSRPAGVEAEVGEARTSLVLDGAGLGEVEAGPGVEDERTEGGAVERPAGPGGRHQYRHDTDFLLS